MPARRIRRNRAVEKLTPSGVQTAETTYTPFITEDDAPVIWLNEGIMAQWRERMRAYYYDPSKFDTYLEQLGIEYPVTRTRPVSEGMDGEPGGGR